MAGVKIFHFIIFYHSYFLKNFPAHLYISWVSLCQKNGQTDQNKNDLKVEKTIQLFNAKQTRYFFPGSIAGDNLTIFTGTFRPLSADTLPFVENS
ncbi:MAG: hypothetical protein B6D37_03925 [Sphingobacteriales bacterium UTBCD1]|jgi:hypothetical protein|nr:MAG: hypothetical protein B6D37_03925 [Sphingobacteriales bacterium UTBCD1]